MQSACRPAVGPAGDRGAHLTRVQVLHVQAGGPDGRKRRAAGHVRRRAAAGGVYTRLQQAADARPGRMGGACGRCGSWQQLLEPQAACSHDQHRPRDHALPAPLCRPSPVPPYHPQR